MIHVSPVIIYNPLRPSFSMLKGHCHVSVHRDKNIATNYEHRTKTIFSQSKEEVA
jgi:hypothetical protein